MSYLPIVWSNQPPSERASAIAEAIVAFAATLPPTAATLAGLREQVGGRKACHPWKEDSAESWVLARVGTGKYGAALLRLADGQVVVAAFGHQGRESFVELLAVQQLDDSRSRCLRGLWERFRTAAPVAPTEV